MKKTTLSVIIPAYNAARTIEKCLLSLKEQSFKDFEAIVVDDGSTDETADIAARFANVVRLKQNFGVGYARNAGAREATGDVLVFTDSDVSFPPDWLENIVRGMEKYGVSCIGGGYRGSVGNSFMELFAYWELFARRKGTSGFVNTLVANNFACTRKIFFECGGFPEKHKCEDMRLSYLIGRKYKIYWDENNGVYHRFRTSLGAYLKQQYEFSRDTVWSYYCYPKMLLKRTHQGRRVYMDVLITLAALLCFVIQPVLAGILLAALFLSNLNFLMLLKRQRLPVGRSFGIIFIRSVACIVGIAAGVGMCLENIIRKVSNTKSVSPRNMSLESESCPESVSAKVSA